MQEIERPPVEILRQLKANGMNDIEIGILYGASSTTVRRWRKEADIRGLRMRRTEMKRQYYDNIETVRRLRDDGYSFTVISTMVDVPEPTIRGWLQEKRYTRDAIIKGAKRAIYDYIICHKRDNNGNSPTYEAIAQAVNVSAPTVRRYTRELDIDGRIQIVVRNGRSCDFIVPDSQWLPPENWKQPESVRQQDRKDVTWQRVQSKLEKEGRLCDCGREAFWYFDAPVGNAGTRRTKPRMERIPLCHECKELEEGSGIVIHPLEVAQHG